jgi:hypothetical protein
MTFYFRRGRIQKLPSSYNYKSAEVLGEGIAVQFD